MSPPAVKRPSPGPVAEPVRVQRMRTRGWRMPADTISVSRPSKWGNPFRPEPRSRHGVEFWVAAPLTTALSLAAHHATEVQAVAECVDKFRREAQHPSWTEMVEELRGYNLACWCPLTRPDGTRAPCHADVLLELANA